MAITTFATLKSAMRDWLTESSTTILPDGTLDDLIAFCEDDLNTDRDFRLLEMQQAKLTDLNAGDPNVTLPLDYLEMQYVTETTDPARGPLTYLSPEGLASQEANPGYLGHYTIIGGQLRLDSAPEAGKQLEMGYFGKIPALSVSNTTNWLLSKSRKTYLFGALTYAEPFLDNDPRITVWKALFEASKNQLITANRAAISTGGTLQVGLPETVA
jgi:hypothetical protein